MRDHLIFFLNGQKMQVRGRDAFLMLAPFLRRVRGLTGTKIACAHGACGSCSVLLGRPDTRWSQESNFHYQAVNACIFPVFACDGAHIITIEGLNGPKSVGGQDDGLLSPVQQAMVECHGSQCGFCTPGVVVALTAFHQKSSSELPVLKNEVQTALEGNLCRCTGYTSIIEAAMSVKTTDLLPLNELYPPDFLQSELEEFAQNPVEIVAAADELEPAQHLFAPRLPEDAARWNTAHPDAVIVAGATEIGVKMSVNGFAPRYILNLSRIDGLNGVTIEDGILVLGARATWTQVEQQIRETLPEFSAFLARWGSPQLRNIGTVAGSITGASPISDSLPLLLVCEAELEFLGEHGPQRVPIAEFLNGSPNARPKQLLQRVLVPLPSKDQRLCLFKIAKRRAFDRSIVSAAFLVSEHEGHIENIKIALGGVASTAIRLPKTEAFLRGKAVKTATWREAASVAQTEISPVSDAAASREYRGQLVANLLQKLGCEIETSPL